jgi:hypothetical protein
MRARGDGRRACPGGVVRAGVRYTSVLYRRYRCNLPRSRVVCPDSEAETTPPFFC